MIQIPPQAVIFTLPDILEPDEDFDDLVGYCQRHNFDPFSGQLFVFKNLEKTQISIFSYDGHGFQWCSKRFSAGTIGWWPAIDGPVRISARDLQIILWGGDPRNTEFPPMWRPFSE